MYWSKNIFGYCAATVSVGISPFGAINQSANSNCPADAFGIYKQPGVNLVHASIGNYRASTQKQVARVQIFNKSNSLTKNVSTR